MPDQQAVLDNAPAVMLGMASHNGTVPELTQRSLDGLVKHSIKSGIKLALTRRYGAILPDNRNGIVDEAIKQEADWLLFIDTDMVFDNDSLLRLLKWDRDIVTGLSVMRQPPFAPIAKVRADSGMYQTAPHVAEGRFLTGLDVIGMAFTLIRMKVFRDIKKPWFAMPPYLDTVMGEDVYFCDQAKAAGYEICCDTSLIIGHLGFHVFTIDDFINYSAERTRREQEKEQEKVNV